MMQPELFTNLHREFTLQFWVALSETRVLISQMEDAPRLATPEQVHEVLGHVRALSACAEVIAEECAGALRQIEGALR